MVNNNTEINRKNLEGYINSKNKICNGLDKKSFMNQLGKKPIIEIR
jgi:hypothetical protein